MDMNVCVHVSYIHMNVYMCVHVRVYAYEYVCPSMCGYLHMNVCVCVSM